MTGLVRDAFEEATKNWPHRPAIWFSSKEILYAQLNAPALTHELIKQQYSERGLKIYIETLVLAKKLLVKTED